MKKIISLVMALMLCIGMAGCSLQQIDPNQIQDSKSHSIDDFSKQLESDLNAQSTQGTHVQIVTNNKKDTVTIYYKNTEEEISVDEFKQSIINNDYEVCDTISSNFNTCLHKYHENGFNDIQLVVCYVDSRNVLLMRLIGSEDIDSETVRNYFNDFIDEDNDVDNQSNSNNDSSNDNNNSESNPNIQSNSDLQSGYDAGLINTLKIQTESINSYLGEPQIEVNHESYIVRMTYNNAPSELLTLIEQGRWTDEDYVNAYSYLDDNVKEIVGQEYDTVLTIKCNGQVLYAN